MGPQLGSVFAQARVREGWFTVFSMTEPDTAPPMTKPYKEYSNAQDDTQ